MNSPTQHRSWISGICGRAAGARPLALAVLFGLAVLAATPGEAQNFTTFEAPGAGTGGSQGTISFSINTAGAVAGMYYDASNAYHGFVRAATGTITTFEAPGAGTGAYQGTVSLGINPAGVIAGTYVDANYVYHGFVRSCQGRDNHLRGSGRRHGQESGNRPHQHQHGGGDRGTVP